MTSGAGRIWLSPSRRGRGGARPGRGRVDSGWVAPVGPEIEGFEADLSAAVGMPNAVALSSGTAALHLALLELGVGPGDDVLVSTFTFAASAFAVAYTGARPVFVDSDEATWNLSPELLADELDERARRGDGRRPQPWSSTSTGSAPTTHGSCRCWPSTASP